MDYKPMLLVMNPRAGTQSGRGLLTDILSLFCANGYMPMTFITNARGEATQIVQQYAAQVSQIVCIGGDGTLNETLSGLLQSGIQVPVGYIPAGSTNDFAGSLNLPKDLLEAARHIVEGTPQLLDIGQFEEHYFSYTASFGLFTRASYATSQEMKNLFGHFAYILEGIRDLSSIHTYRLRIENDAVQTEGDYLFGAVCNSTSLGGIIKLDSEAVDMSDGLFEVFFIKRPANLIELHECVMALNNHQYNCNMIDFFTASHLTIYCEEPMDWTLDGEHQPGKDVIHIKNVHHAFSLLTKN